jgi:hypothetical protein
MGSGWYGCSVVRFWAHGIVGYTVRTADLYFFGARQVLASDLSKQAVPLGHFGIVLTASSLALGAYTISHSQRVRLAVALLCILAPMFFAATGPVGPAALIAIPLAPIFGVSALMGRQDGEFYAEGFLAFVAVGWWMILWSILLFREIRCWAHKSFAH